MEKILFTSESVTEGHPDKMCDAISDAILDALMEKDPMSRVACETATTTGLVLVMGEITTNAYVDIQKIVRDTIREIGYTRGKYGFDADTCAVITAIDEQSADIALGVDKALEAKMGEDEIDAIGAGDQGIQFGYASNETEEYMPYAINMAHKLARQLTKIRKDGTLKYLRPDGKSQVTVEYDENGKPVYKDYCNPTTKEFRDELYGNIIDAYMNDKKELEVKGASNKFEFGIALRSFSGENIEALGRIYFDKCFVINNVKVIPSEKGSFVAMPSQLVNKENGEKEYEDVCFPITKEFRTELYDAILKEKDIMKQKQQEEFQKIDEMDKDNLPFR